VTVSWPVPGLRFSEFDFQRPDWAGQKPKSEDLAPF